MIDAHTINETRNEQDFLEHIKKTVSTSPKSQWIFVMDQLLNRGSFSSLENLRLKLNRFIEYFSWDL